MCNHLHMSGLPSLSRVLVVDDEEHNVQLISRIVRPEAQTVIARSAEEARVILAEGGIDVMIVDHRLPGESGASLLRHAAETAPTVGRILVTAYGDHAEVVAACKSEIVQHLFLKPFSPARLKVAVLEVLRNCGRVDPPWVLLADQDQTARSALALMLSTHGIASLEAENGTQAIQIIDQQPLDAALVDLSTPRMDGLAILEHCRTRHPDLPVIVVTDSDVSVGLNFLEAGAFDFLNKPIVRGELVVRIRRAILHHHQAGYHDRLLNEAAGVTQHERLVAHSSQMRHVLERARSVASFDVNVLVTGETGTGKEEVSRVVHRAGRRAEGTFLAINCGALPEQLIERELFGHEKGSFTDAKTSQMGMFEAATGGTILLDEIGELSLHAQSRLLRVIDAKEVTRIGANKPTSVDVRIIAATHKDLERMVEAGAFRQDLYYRLNVFHIHVPPLRERPDDIAPLMERAALDFCRRNDMPIPEIDNSVIRQALGHNWPGNVRELFHVIERSLVLSGGRRLLNLDLGSPLGPHSTTAPMPSQLNAELPLREAIDSLLEELERQYIIDVLEKNDGRIGRAAEHAGIHRKSLYNKMKKYGLSAKQ